MLGRRKVGPALKRQSLSATALAFTMFCCVSGGPFGLEPAVKASGPVLALVLIAVLPLIWALPDALTTAELASAIPEEGGYTVWVRRAIGPLPAFLDAWWTWLYSLVDASIYPVLFTSYLGKLSVLAGGHDPFYGRPLLRWGVAVAIIALFSGLNVRGTKTVGRSSTLFSLLLLFPFVAFVVIGLGHMGPVHSAVPPSTGSLTESLGAGLAIVMWNYLGWDSLSTVAGEVEGAERAYPRAIALALPLVSLCYLVPVWIGLKFVPDATAWDEGSWPQIARSVGGQVLALTVGAAALISPIAQFTSNLLASSRIPFALAEEGYFPRWLIDLHPKFGTPWKTILLSAGVFAVLAEKRFQELVALNVVLFACALVLEGISLVALRIKEPELVRPFKIPGGLPAVILVAASPALLSLILVSSEVRQDGWGKQIPTGLALISGPILFLTAKIVRARREPGEVAGEQFD